MKKNLLLFTLIILVIAGCKNSSEENKITLTLGAYTVPKEVYQKEIIPAFKKFWKEKTGQEVIFYESYIASGAQSRAIAAGFDADIAALSLEQDVDRLKKAGLIKHNWKDNKHNGFVTCSLVVIVFRPKNPLKIRDWNDLTKSNIEILYPSPKTSGGAMWIVNAIYGAGLKLSEGFSGKVDPEYAYNLLKKIQNRVKVMDKSGRASVTTFESGIGDVLLTYENEAFLRQKQGKDFPFIVPGATILIENPVAIIDKNVDKHKNRKVAEAFLNFLFTKNSQRAYANYGFRPVNKEIFKEFQEKYPVPEHLFDISYLGGWNHVSSYIYGPQGIWSQMIEELANDE